MSESSTDQQLLEVGSGTGQHAVYFAQHLPQVHWQTSDLEENHGGIKAWIEDCPAENLYPPLELEVGVSSHWPLPSSLDVIFTANTAHIMSWSNVLNMLAMAGASLRSQGLLIIYGPFNYKGDYTSPSNADFDQWLKQRDPDMGIRHFEIVCEEAKAQGLQLLDDHAMPANNRCLVFEKVA